MMGDAHDRLIMCNASELMRDGVPPPPCTALSGSRRGGADLLARPRALWRRGACKAVPECAGGQPAQVRECRHASGKSGGAARPHPVHASRAAVGQAVGGWSTCWRAPISAHGSRSYEPAPEGYRTHHTVRVATRPRYMRIFLDFGPESHRRTLGLGLFIFFSLHPLPRHQDAPCWLVCLNIPTAILGDVDPRTR